MKKEKIILLFHISHGGGNNKKLSYHGKKDIVKCDAFSNQFIKYDKDSWSVLLTCDGKELMSDEEYQKATTTGIGRLEIDGDYNTWYTEYFNKISENEFKALDVDTQKEYLNIVNEIPLDILNKINEKSYSDMYHNHNDNEHDLQIIIDWYVNEDRIDNIRRI